MHGKKSKNPQFLIPLLVMIFYPRIAYAYVDPGFLTTLYQFFYIFIFGTLTVIIFKPWYYIRALFKKSPKKNDKNENNDKGKKNPSDKIN